MGHSFARLLHLAAMLLLWPTSFLAQRPTPDQAQRLLQTRPDLVAQLRARIMTSGMTPDQVRARLRAEGYPENLLDAYLVGGGMGADSLPSADVFAAVRSLGIADSADVAALQGVPRNPAVPDSLARATGRPAEREIFGLRLFQGGSSLFEPNLAGPVDANYRLGPGDQLVLILTGDVEAAHTLDVTREGFVVIPQVGYLRMAFAIVCNCMLLVPS